jgi:hypothetical protein
LEFTEVLSCEVWATGTGKLLDSLPRNDAVAELYSLKFSVAYRRDPVLKLPPPASPPQLRNLNTCDKYDI